MEVRDAMKAGKTTATDCRPAGHRAERTLRADRQARLRAQGHRGGDRPKLGDALIAPAIPFEPGGASTTPGTLQVRDSTYEAAGRRRGRRPQGQRFQARHPDRRQRRQPARPRARRDEAGRTRGRKRRHDSLRQGVLRQLDGRRRRVGLARGAQDERRRHSRQLQRRTASSRRSIPRRSGSKQRQDAGKASINGRRCCRSRRRSPTARSWWRFAPDITVEAIKKALAAK